MSGIPPRAVLVTGGAAGIGWATAQRFAASGDRVMIADIDAAAATARAASLGLPHGAVTADMGHPDHPRAMVEDCVTRFGRIDVLVNNAGRIDAGGTSVIDQPLEAFRRLLAINLLGVQRAAEAAAAFMRAQGGGVIVNVASAAALKAIPLRNGYSASKAGVVALTRNMACRWARHGVRVNAVAPGYTRTDLVDELIRNGRVDPAKAVLRIPLGRMGTPAEIAATIFFLASDEAGGMAGSLLLADGGGMAYGGSEPACVMRGSGPVPAPGGRQVAVIAGAGTRLGRIAMEALAAQGFATIPCGGDAGPPDQAVDQALRAFGRIDGLVTAGGTDTLSETGLPAGVEQHLEAAFLATQAAGRAMLQQGFGAVVNMVPASSQVGLSGPEDGDAAAAAVGMFTRTVACEWGGSGIRVNALAAGATDGGSLHRVPLGRTPHPHEIGGAVRFLLSPEAGYVTGSLLTVDGGMSIYGGPDLAPAAAARSR